MRDQRTRLVLAELHGAAMHHARWHEPTPEETAAAVAELHEIAPGRTDLLAEVAGVLIGFNEGTLEELRACVAAHFCIAAGAAPELADEWIAEGRRRAERAARPPFGVKVL
jgi:hypothetical protein